MSKRIAFSDERKDKGNHVAQLRNDGKKQGNKVYTRDLERGVLKRGNSEYAQYVVQNAGIRGNGARYKRHPRALARFRPQHNS